jgi:hypothetical protein
MFNFETVGKMMVGCIGTHIVQRVAASSDLPERKERQRLPEVRLSLLNSIAYK